MSRRLWLVIVVGIGLVLAGPAPFARAHPWHGAITGSDASLDTGLDGAHHREAQRGEPAAPLAHRPVQQPHSAPSPLALAAGALVLLAPIVRRRRALALGLALVLATAGFEGVLHATLHLHHVAHGDGLAIGASIGESAAADDPGIPAAAPRLLLGPAPEHPDELRVGIYDRSDPGRAPPTSPA